MFDMAPRFDDYDFWTVHEAAPEEKADTTDEAKAVAKARGRARAHNEDEVAPGRRDLEMRNQKRKNATPLKEEAVCSRLRPSQTGGDPKGSHTADPERWVGDDSVSSGRQARTHPRWS